MMDDNTREFPEDYNMRAQLEVRQDAHAPIPATLWQSALEYDGPDIAEQLCEPELYHAAIEQPLGDTLVGLRFDFSVEDAGQIVALGTAHPAQKIHGNIHTNTDTTLTSARILVHPESAESARAIRAHIEGTGRSCACSP